MGRRSREPPLRIQWVLELLDLTPADQVQIGCGPGVAASLVGNRLADGSIIAIDRSATAIARARARNAHHLESGRLALEEVALAEFCSDKRFDKAFSVNVNVFWTTTATPSARHSWQPSSPMASCTSCTGGRTTLPPA